MATFTIPPNTHIVGDNTITADLDNLYTVVSGIPHAIFNVLNTAYSGGADPTNTNDCTSAFNACLAAIQANGGGTLYIPTGDFQIQGAVTWSGTVPLRILGDGPQASRIRMNNSGTSSTYFSLTNTGSWGDEKGLDGTVIIDGVSFHNDHYVGAFSDTNIALYMNGVNFGLVVNCGFYKGAGSQRVNQAIVLNACNQIVVDNSVIFAAVNGIAFTGYCQVNTIRDVTIWTPSGTGVATAAAILYQGQTLGTHIRTAILHDGDRGILWTQDSIPQQPHIFVGWDVEFNNHTIAACEVDYGVHWYLTNCIFSGAAVSANVPGLLFGSNFTGDAIIDDCEFIGQPGRAVDIEAGQGFTFSNCVFGGGGTYKFAANTYDEIFIAGVPTKVTIDACHFNVNENAGLGTSNAPRAAVYVTSGAADVVITNSMGAGAGVYGTAAVVDNGNPGVVFKRGNIGLGMPDNLSGSGSTATSASVFSNLSASLSIPEYDMVVSKIYKFEAYGHGTEATGTAVNLSIRGNVGGQSLGTWTPATDPAAGASFFWKYELVFRITVTGGSGTATLNAIETFTWNGVASQHGNTGFTTFATTAANAIVLTAEWASTTGSPTITCDATTLTPLQNWPAS
jgi:hypothetical protein